MEVFVVPANDLYIIYRPLLPLAFVGNKTMADLALQIAANGVSPEFSGETRDFLEEIGFFRPDPPEPPFPTRNYRPTTAVMLMTNRCNLRCTYCYANAGIMQPQDTPIELGHSVIDRVCQNAMDTGAPRFEVCFHGGGEPMQAWRVMQQAAEYARSKPHACDLTMVSNGIWSPAQREWVLNTLTSLTISLDGGPETQNRQRPLVSGEGSYRHVIETTRALDAANFRYGIRMTATAPWREQFPEDIRYLCDQTGCKEFQVEPAFNTERGKHQQASYDESQAFVEAFLEAHEIAAKEGRRLTYSGARPWLRGRAFCTAPYNALIVNADGNLVTCYEIASDSHWLSAFSTIGQVVDGEPQVNQPARDLLLDFIEGKQDTQCQSCFCRWHCAGDCYTRASMLDEDGIKASRKRCYVNQEITKNLILWNIMATGGTVWRGENVL